MPWTGFDVEEQDDYITSGDDDSNFGDEAQRDRVADDDDPPVDDQDSDDDAPEIRAHEPSTISEKRRAQNEIMREFAANISAQITQKEVDEAAVKGANEGQLSIRDILTKQDTTVRIINPREFQTELFQRVRSTLIQSTSQIQADHIYHPGQN